VGASYPHAVLKRLPEDARSPRSYAGLSGSILDIFAWILGAAPLHSTSQIRATRGSDGVEELCVMTKGVVVSGGATSGLER
jgi:hypothetical protein